MAPWSLRTATTDDAEQVADVLNEGFEGYRSFAPRGWEPPPAAGELRSVRARLADPATWCLLAEVDGAPAGHVALMPAALHSAWPSDDPGLGHVWQLFVRPPWQGSGLASELHARLVARAGERGLRELRLFTPAGQARARRFYEREGWRPAAAEFDEPALGLVLVEYRRAISSSV
jgi:GNAT superfamily N-acetyltransferase